MLLELRPDNPDTRKIDQIVAILRKGGVIVVPTDSVYSFACDLNNKRAIEKMAGIKGLKPKKANFSLICYDLSTLSDFTRQIDRPTFKILNKAFPGPYTFILPANSQVPRLFDSNKKEVGIRIPDNDIPREIVNRLGNPLACTSVLDDEDHIMEYITDPNMIFQDYEHVVDVVVNGGPGNVYGSTVIDCTGDEPEVLREGLGSLEVLS